MKLTWYGHSCFKLESKNGSVVFDPYNPGSVPGVELPMLEADMVLCSHKHGDHYGIEMVRESKSTPSFAVHRIPSFHDDANGEKRGLNYISVVESEGIRVAHLGDLGHLLSPAQVKALGRIDVLLVPVGGFYTIDALQAAETVRMLSPRITLPMHYRGDGFGYDVIGTLEDFTKYFNNVLFSKSNTLEISDLPAAAVTIALKCPVK